MRVNSLTGFSYDPALPEEFRLLCMLHNIGAITLEKSLSIKEICEWTTIDASIVTSFLQKLVELGYVQFIETGGIKKYHVTPSGITKVLTLYS